jgi:hypothetical protein
MRLLASESGESLASLPRETPREPLPIASNVRRTLYDVCASLGLSVSPGRGV